MLIQRKICRNLKKTISDASNNSSISKFLKEINEKSAIGLAAQVVR